MMDELFDKLKDAGRKIFHVLDGTTDEEKRHSLNNLPEEEKEVLLEQIRLFFQSHRAYFAIAYKIFSQVPGRTIDGSNSGVSQNYKDFKPIFKEEIPLDVFEKMMDRLDADLSRVSLDDNSIEKIMSFLQEIKRKEPRINQTTERNFASLFKEYILNPCEELFNSRDFGIEIFQEPPVGSRSDIKTFPDMSVRQSGNTVLVVEMKNHGVLDLFNKRHESNAETNRIIKQILVYLLRTKTTTCILTDFVDTMVLRLRRPSKSTQEMKETEAEFDYKLVSINDGHMTLQAVFAALTYHQINRSEAEKKEDEEICREVDSLLRKDSETSGNEMSETSLRDSSRGASPQDKVDLEKIEDTHSDTCESFEGFECLQEGYEGPTLVYRVNFGRLAGHFPRLHADGVAADDNVVVKLYDPRKEEEHYMLFEREYDMSIDDFRVHCYRKFVNEIECYNRIAEHNLRSGPDRQIRTPKLYDYGRMQLFEGNGPAVFHGFFMLFSYVEDQKSTITEDTIQDACKQMRLLAEIGIGYDGMEESNVLVHQGTPYLIDFADAHQCETEADNSGEEAALKSLLERLERLEIEPSEDLSDVLSIYPVSPSTAPTTATSTYRSTAHEHKNHGHP